MKVVARNSVFVPGLLKSSAVMLHDATLPFVVESADGSVLVDVRVRQSIRDDAADVDGFFEQDDLRTGFCHHHGCGDSGRMGGDDDNIGLLYGESCEASQNEGKESLVAVLKAGHLGFPFIENHPNIFAVVSGMNGFEEIVGQPAKCAMSPICFASSRVRPTLFAMITAATRPSFTATSQTTLW